MAQVGVYNSDRTEKVASFFMFLLYLIPAIVTVLASIMLLAVVFLVVFVIRILGWIFDSLLGLKGY